MKELWQFVLLGAGLTAAFTLSAQSMVVVFRGSGVVNFAASGFAAISAYGYYALRTVGIPTVLALAAALCIGAAVGAVTYMLVMRRLAKAAPVTQVIGTLGVSIVIVQTLALIYGQNEDTLNPLFGNSGLNLFGATVDVYSLAIFGITILLTVGLWAAYRFTRFGLETTAVAENGRSAAALGISPLKVGLRNWMVGGVLAALAGVLIAPIIGLTVVSLSLLLVPALAAALFGHFRSFWGTLLGGAIVGLGESLLTHYNLGTGWSTSFPFLVLILVLMFRGSSLPARGFIQERLPAIGTGRIRLPLVAGAVLAALVATSFLSSVGAGAVVTTASTGIIVLSVVSVAGYAGQVSLAQLGLAGMGAFFAARLCVDLQLSFWVVLILGVGLTLPLGAIVGLPAIRARGVNLTIVTLGLGLVIQDVIFGNDALTGGYSGLQVSQPSIFGYALDFTNHPNRYACLTILLFTGAAIVVANLRRGRVGRQLIAVRANERAAAALGIELTQVKLYSFALGSGLAALGGILLAFSNSIVLINSLPFDVNSSIALLGFVVMGGIGFIGGAIFGGLAITGGVMAWLLSLFLGGDATNWLALVGGIGTVFTVTFQPDGVAGKIVADFHAKRGRRTLRATTSVAQHAEAPSRKPHAAQSVLEVRDLSVQFAEIKAVQNLSLAVRSGEIVGVIGPNGAGKTTLVDAITGINRRYTGSVVLDGSPLDRQSASQRSRAGLGRSFQSLELFDDLTVEDNLRVAADRPRAMNYITDLIKPGSRPLTAAALATVREFELADHLDAHPVDLPFGRRRLVGIARAVAAAPRILLLDEPASGLDDRESRELADMLRRLVDDWHFGILLIEHDMNLVMSVCDSIVALDFGSKICEGTPDHVRGDPTVVAAYLGASGVANPSESTRHAHPLSQESREPTGNQPAARKANQ